MSNWARCIICHCKPGSDKPFLITACGHLFCEPCQEFNADSCKICKTSTTFMKITKELKSEVQVCFSNPEEFIKKAITSMKFQTRSYDALLKQLLKDSENFKRAKNEIKKSYEEIKKSREEIKKYRSALDKSRKETQLLKSKLQKMVTGYKHNSLPGVSASGYETGITPPSSKYSTPSPGSTNCRPDNVFRRPAPIFGNNMQPRTSQQKNDLANFIAVNRLTQLPPSQQQRATGSVPNSSSSLSQASNSPFITPPQRNSQLNRSNNFPVNNYPQNNLGSRMAELRRHYTINSSRSSISPHDLSGLSDSSQISRRDLPFKNSSISPLERGMANIFNSRP